MTVEGKLAAKARAAFEPLVLQARGDARKLAALSALALANGPADRAYGLAREARALAPEDPEVLSLTAGPLSAGVPNWHFGIVRDEARNQAYDAALRRAVGPGARVLDIGSGTGLLAMMAARAGAAAVVTCEMNPAVADAATDIVALNGYADRVRVIAKRSTDLDPDADMGGRADVLVSEIVSNDLLREGALPVMEDAVARLLKPGGRMIPESGRIRVALAHWAGLDRRRMSLVAGFDMTPFNRLARRPERLEVGDPELALRGPAADLFEFDFSSGGPYRPGRATVNLVADGQAINGVAQWISLRMDAAGDYENQPAAGASSCWACLFHPFERELRPLAGTAMSIHGAHTRQALRIWSGGTA